MKPAFADNINIEKDSVFAQELNRLGGEETLKKHYPEVYRVLLYSHQRQKEILVKGAAPPSLEADQKKSGFVSALGIRTLNYAAETDVRTSSQITMTNEQESLILIGELWQDTSNELLDSYAIAKSNVKKIDSTAKRTSRGLRMLDSMRFHATTTFARIVTDDEGNPYYQTETLTESALKTLEGDSIVQGVEVFDPIPKNHPGSDRTVIYYNNREGDGCDYSYKGVVTKDDGVEVMVEFAGKALFNDNTLPGYIDFNRGFILQLLANDEHGGVAEFGGEIDSKEFSVNENTLSWRFPKEWKSWLYTSDFRVLNNVDFYCRMYVKLKEYGLYVPIVIYSSDEEHEDPAYKKICKLQIEWGCFAKGTRILMADGTEKPVENICAGDKVMTKKGVSSVEEFVTGTEKDMVLIVTESGKRICVTSDHPILTYDGWKTAHTLTAADMLQTVGGEEHIVELHMQDYNDRVYSLRISDDDAVVANGIYSGDFNRQNKMDNKNEAPKKKEAYQEEIEALICNLDKKMKGNV